MEANLPTPMTARVYVNLPEGTLYTKTIQNPETKWVIDMRQTHPDVAPLHPASVPGTFSVLFLVHPPHYSRMLCGAGTWTKLVHSIKVCPSGSRWSKHVFSELNEGELCKNTLSIMDGFPLNVHSAQLNETLESEELQCRQFSDMWNGQNMVRVIGASGHPILGILMMGIKTTIKG